MVHQDQLVSATNPMGGGLREACARLSGSWHGQFSSKRVITCTVRVRRYPCTSTSSVAAQWLEYCMCRIGPDVSRIEDFQGIIISYGGQLCRLAVASFLLCPIPFPDIHDGLNFSRRRLHLHLSTRKLARHPRPENHMHRHLE